MNITAEQRKSIDNFIFNDLAKREWQREQRDWSYPQWKYGGRKWGILHQGGTGIMLLLMWYHHSYKPKSKEWRPSKIIAAACSFLKI